jgi:hypothetical protein
MSDNELVCSKESCKDCNCCDYGNYVCPRCNNCDHSYLAKFCKICGLKIERVCDKE